MIVIPPQAVPRGNAFEEFTKTKLKDILVGYSICLLQSSPDYVPKVERAPRHEGQSKVVLDEENHEYAIYVPACGKFKLLQKGGKGISVSGLLKRFVEKDSFAAVMHNASNARARTNHTVLATIARNNRSSLTPDELAAKFPTTQEGVKRMWNQASAHGTRCHALCERWYLGELEFDSPEMTDPSVAHEMSLFRKFVESNVIVNASSSASSGAGGASPHGRDMLFDAEVSMTYIPLLITGQADLILKVRGEENVVDLLDYKFTSKMNQSKTPNPAFQRAFPSYVLTKQSVYAIQLMLYKALIEHHFKGVTVRNLKMVNIDPSVCETYGVRNASEPTIIDVKYEHDIVMWILEQRQNELIEAILKTNQELAETDPEPAAAAPVAAPAAPAAAPAAAAAPVPAAAAESRDVSGFKRSRVETSFERLVRGVDDLEQSRMAQSLAKTRSWSGMRMAPSG